MAAMASRKLIQIQAAMRRKRIESLGECIRKSYHEETGMTCACRHEFFTLPMTPVMDVDVGIHGLLQQVVTCFTLGI